MSKRCSAGIHAYRHLSIEPLPDPLGWGAAWQWIRRCKRCGLTLERVRFRYPRIIRTHDWKSGRA